MYKLYDDTDRSVGPYRLLRDVFLYVASTLYEARWCGQQILTGCSSWVQLRIFQVGRVLGGLTCQCEFGVLWIQISLWRLEARKHLRLVKVRKLFSWRSGELSAKLLLPKLTTDVYTVLFTFQRRCLFSIYAISGFPTVLWYHANSNLSINHKQLSWTV